MPESRQGIPSPPSDKQSGKGKQVETPGRDPAKRQRPKQGQTAGSDSGNRFRVLCEEDESYTSAADADLDNVGRSSSPRVVIFSESPPGYITEAALYLALKTIDQHSEKGADPS